MNAYDKLQNEGGEGYVDYNTRYPAEPTKEQQQAIIDAAQAEFTAEWTVEVTAARRAAWNELAVKKVDPREIQKKLGFNLMDLKRAVSLHAK